MVAYATTTLNHDLHAIPDLDAVVAPLAAVLDWRRLDPQHLADQRSQPSHFVPGFGAVLIPWWILASRREMPPPVAWPAVAVIAVGAALYVACLWVFATVGRGTPGPWDAPRRVVAVGPYRWVRNPIYVAALLVVVGEAWLFLSLPLLVYAGAMAIGFHLFVIGYEEPTLRRRFGGTYDEYRRSVGRWIPRLPRRG